MMTVCMLYYRFATDFALWRVSQIFSGFAEGGMKISGFLAAGFLKIMVKNLFRGS